MSRPRIVVGVDESSESAAAARWAAREALCRDAPLHLVHAWAWSPCPPTGTPEAAGRRGRPARAVAFVAERLVEILPAGYATTGTVEGPATSALLKAAETAGMLVLGSRGLGAVAGVLVGSVAAAVTARASCPVVLVKEDAGGAGHAADSHDVVLGLDLGDPCDEVIDFAFEAARTHRARLHVVSAWPRPGPLTVGPGEIALTDESQQAREWDGFQDAVLRTWRDKYPGVDVCRTLTQGRPQTALPAAASEAGLVVVGRRRRHEPYIGPRTGPVAHAALHHVLCPVAVVPHD
ncbi:universal stress protein [Streptomyces longispororuber]|uniref:universal stress protein n=1 Tax=Streptomyces longispororuber TaxID=68230 RepID=UPI00210D37AB|nr:universal stress protein [Streptomyces longispororuber]MCQ4205692.1 universal stress protein [Streptomyces longispororuber]